MRTFVLFAISKDVTGHSRLIATTQAKDFHGAARNLAGRILPDDFRARGGQDLILTGYGELREFEAGVATPEALADAARRDPHTDVGADLKQGMNRYHDVIDHQSVGMVLATAPLVPAAV